MERAPVDCKNFDTRVGKEMPSGQTTRMAKESWLSYPSILRMIVEEGKTKLRGVQDPVRQVNDIIVEAGEFTREIWSQDSVS